MNIAKIILAVATTAYLLIKIVATIQDQIDKHNKK